MKGTIKLSSHLLLLLCLLGLPGCGGGDDGPARAPVSGRLTIDGKAEEGVEVHFYNPDFPKDTGFGTTDENGNFKLVQGAVPGTNTVFFSKLKGDPSVMNLPDDVAEDSGQLEAMGLDPGTAEASGIQQLIPQEYSTGASKLTVNVPEGGTDSANFDL